MQVGYLGGAGLKDVRDFFRVDADRKVVDHVVTDVLFDLFETRQPRGQHVIVGDQQERFVLILEPYPVCEGADVVPNVKLARRAVTRQDPLPRRFRRRRGSGAHHLRLHGTADASARASSSATSRPTSSRLPTKKWSTPFTTAMRARGNA